MDLREYFFRKEISATDFAKEIGFTRSYISNIANKKIKPGRKLALVIEKATNGNVTVKELLSGKYESLIKINTT